MVRCVIVTEMAGTHGYMCSACGMLYSDSPGRYGPPDVHPADECVARVKDQVAAAEGELRNVQYRLELAEQRVKRLARLAKIPPR